MLHENGVEWVRFRREGFDLRLGRKWNSGWRGSATCSRWKRRFGWLDPCAGTRRLRRYHIEDATQLADGDAERKQDQAAGDGSDAGNYEGVAKAEFIDRNAESNHCDPRDDGEGGKYIQQNRHMRCDPLMALRD